MGRTELAAMAEGSIWDREPNWRRGPPHWDVIDRPDLLVWSATPPAGVMSHQVVYARWSRDQVRVAIDEVLSFFRSRGVGEFEWIVGPSSRPEDLGDDLERAGLVREDDSRMMVAQLPLPPFVFNEAVSIAEVIDERGIRDYLRIAYPKWPHERVHRELSERFEYLALPERRGGWLVAYDAGEAVANATWKDSSDGRGIYLKGAGTRPEYRGRGIYSALVAYRCNHALERGCTYASIIALENTSAPILAKRGFMDLGPLPRYVFRRAASQGGEGAEQC